MTVAAAAVVGSRLKGDAEPIRTKINSCLWPLTATACGSPAQLGVGVVRGRAATSCAPAETNRHNSDQTGGVRTQCILLRLSAPASGRGSSCKAAAWQGCGWRVHRHVHTYHCDMTGPNNSPPMQTADTLVTPVGGLNSQVPGRSYRIWPTGYRSMVLVLGKERPGP